MQWKDAPQAGFTSGTPWLKVNDNYPVINVEKRGRAAGFGSALLQKTYRIAQIWGISGVVYLWKILSRHMRMQIT